MMTDRLLLTGTLMLLGAGLFFLARHLHLQLLGRRVAQSRGSRTPGLDGFQAGQPAVLYFSTASCAPCHTVLKPALQRLAAELKNRFQVLKVDAESQPEAARHWGVMSVPTVFVLDPQGQPRYVHYGLVRPEVLRSELSDWVT